MPKKKRAKTIKIFVRIPEDMVEYLDSLVDGSFITSRGYAIRMLIMEHKKRKKKA